jgi:hypothetical protein
VIIERPRLAPFRDQMRAKLAGALGLAVSHVSVKATRGEGMGFVGREEGVATIAVATVYSRGETEAGPPGRGETEAGPPGRGETEAGPPGRGETESGPPTGEQDMN